MSPPVRPPAVAGTFYPSEPQELAALVDRLLGEARTDAPAPKALIAPHAGYRYSGPVAASAYATLAGRTFERVVLLGPAHFVPLRGLAASGAGSWHTPLGEVAVDVAARDRLLDLPQVSLDDEPHAPEHSLEVHLPFVQRAMPGARIVPLLAGVTRPDEVADALDAVWGDDGTVVVISSDLSHYLDHDAAVARDRRTADAILACDPEAIGDGDACGARPIRGLLVQSLRRAVAPLLLDLRTSGDTGGDRDRVVGYGAFAFA